MKIKRLGPNQIEVTVQGWRVLVSYEQPVAAVCGLTVIRSAKKWSNTTTRHVNKWLAGEPGEATAVPQQVFDGLLGEEG